MQYALKQEPVICGLWKFRSPVSRQELVELAWEWREGPHKDNFRRLYVRDASRDQFALGFEFAYSGERADYNAFWNETTDKLKRRFGNDFCGWDVSSTMTIIK